MTWLGWLAGRNSRLISGGGGGRGWRAGVLTVVPTLVASGLVPVTAVVAGAAALTAAGVWRASVPAKASLSGSVLILSTSVNGGSSSVEAARASALGLTVTVDTPTTWDSLTQANFESYKAIIIGDPSTSTCATTVPVDALSTAATWSPAVTGNVAVVGTAPVLGGASGLVSDAISWAASGSGTGLYVSLNCEYSSASAGTVVSLLAGVDGGGFAVTGRSGSCPSNAGTVNTGQSVVDSSFAGLASSSLGPWSSPACSVEESFAAWPSGLGGLAYDQPATPANFTASDGAAAGQPYILSGAVASSGTLNLAPSTGGEVPLDAGAGGSNPADPGLSHGSVGNVDTEDGVYSESDTDVSIPSFGEGVDFTRTYDAQLAQQETATGTPGPLGYGWTDEWASSMTTGTSDQPVPGDLYAMDGTGLAGVGQAPTSVALSSGGPWYVLNKGGNTYIADEFGNRVLEVAGSTGTQWGISMTSGDEYVIAGNPAGIGGRSASGAAANVSQLLRPEGMAVDSSGDLYIADEGNNRVLELTASTGTQWGISMTANHLYAVAGHGSGSAGHSGDGGVATSAFLTGPTGLAFGPGTGDLYIADAGNNRVQEVPAAAETQWGQSMTANDIYTVAGNSNGTGGTSGNGVAASPSVGSPSTLMSGPQAISFSSGGDLYIADTFNNRILEVPQSSGTQWGISMTADFSYTVAGSVSGTAGSSGDTGAATSALLDNPYDVKANNGTQLYIADTQNNEIREVARSGHTEWGQSMTANHIYRIAGTGTAGFSGDGSAATSAKLNSPVGVGFDSSVNMYVGDSGNSRVREVSASTANISTFSGNSWTLRNAGDSGPADQASLFEPGGVGADGLGNIYVADTGNNRVQEVAIATRTQFGISMTAGDTYTIAGDAHGSGGSSGDGAAATSALLSDPAAVAADAAGNVYIADTNNNKVREIAATSHTQFGIAMTAGDIYTVAGNGTAGATGNGGTAASAELNTPDGVAVDAAGDLFIADTVNNRIQEVPVTSGTNYGIAMTAAHIYTVAGSATGSGGHTGNGGAASSALLLGPKSVAIDPAGDLYIADTLNSRIQEVFNGGQSWGQAMTSADIYTIAGSATTTSGDTGDGGPASAALLSEPVTVTLDAAGDVYITDNFNSRVQEVAAGSGTQWGQQMNAGDMYTVTGDPAGSQGQSGDGGPAANALFSGTQGIAADPTGNLYITDSTGSFIAPGDSRLREVVSAAGTPYGLYPAPGTTVNGTAYPGALTVSQDNGSQATFYPDSGACLGSYKAVSSGQYCTLPQNVASNLSFGSGTYTYSPAPGQTSTFNSAGQLTSDTDPAGDAVTVAYGSPLPGAGNCPALASWCETVTSPSGRALTLGYNASNLVTTVTDPMGRTWTYAYTGSDLTSVTDPMGNVTSYTYGAGSTGNPDYANNLLTITKPNAQPGGPDAGDHTTNVYDTYGRVTQQTDPMGFVTSYNYCVNAAIGDCMNSATGTGFVTTTDPDGNTTVDDYSQGSLIAESSWTGGSTLTAEQDYGPAQSDSGNAAGTQLDLDTQDPDGNLTTISYDTHGIPMSTSTPSSAGTPAVTTAESTVLGGSECSSTAEASSTCQSSSGPSPVSPGGLITPPSAAPPAGMTWTLTDTDGNVLYSTTGVYQPGSSTVSYSRTTYKLYNGNSVTLHGTSISCTNTAPSMSLPCVTINADGFVTQLGYDSEGDLTSTSTPDGNGSEVATTSYAYDSDGHQTSVISPDGNLAGANSGNYTTVTSYNNDGQQASDSQGDGSGHTVTPRTTIFGHDANGNQTAVEDARGFTTTTAYNADDEPALVTDPDGNATLTCYDGDGNTVQTVPAVGVAANSLTAASCPTAYPAGYSTRLASDVTVSTFDALGNMTSETSPAPAGQTGYETTTYTYDANGNVLTVTAPSTSNGGLSQVTASTYNDAGKLATETTGYGTSAASIVSYCYDLNGNRTSVVYADGNSSGTAPCEASSPWVVNPTAHPTQAGYQTTYSYDSASELVSTTSPPTAAAPSGATMTSTYDPAGNKLTSTNANGVTTTWTYTPVSTIATIAYSGSSAHSVSYTYDANGSKTAMVDATGSSSYTYDPFGELTSTTNGAGQSTGYGFNVDGQVTSIAYPLPASATWATSNTITYAVDNADRLTSVTDFNGNQISIGSTADGLPNSLTLGTSGDTIDTTYDNSDVPSLIKLKNTSATLESFSYSDAPAGEILSETDTPSSSHSPAVYTYDARGRVTSMTPGSGTALSYTFDASSNLTALPSGANATSGYDNAGELTSSTLAGTTTNYVYDADGQRLTTKQGSTTIASGNWNGAGQLNAYTNSLASMTAATYDGSDLRASSTTGSGTQSFVWNATGQDSQLLMDSASAYIYTGWLAPTEQVNLATGSVTYLVTDIIGSVRGIANSSGTLTGTTYYDTWGNPLTAGGLMSATPFGYAGGYTDPTGLIYLINRYYDPQVGQFVSLDPLNSQTLEPYGYAGENPVSNSDPDGQSFQDWAFWSGVSVPQGWIPTGSLHVYFHGSGMYAEYFKGQFTTIRELHHASIRVYITWHPYAAPCKFKYTRTCYPLGEWGYWTGLNEGFVAGPHVTVPSHFDGASVVFALFGWHDGHLIAKTVDGICKNHC